MQQTYLIKLKDDSIEKDFRGLISVLKSGEARIIMTSAERLWVMAAMNQQLADDIRKRPCVKVVGGVTFRKREVRVIRFQRNLA